MRIETKEVLGDYKPYLKFGWQFTSDVSRHYGRCGRRTYHILARDMDMKNYLMIIKLEARYFNLQSQRKPLPEIDKLLTFVLFLLCIFPGIIYLLIKDSEEKKVRSLNSEISKQQLLIIEQVNQLI